MLETETIYPGGNLPNQSRISLPWNGGRKREEFIRCIQS